MVTNRYSNFNVSKETQRRVEKRKKQVTEIKGIKLKTVNFTLRNNVRMFCQSICELSLSLRLSSPFGHLRVFTSLSFHTIT